MEKRENITEDNRQDRPSIFEKKRYIRSFSNRDFYKNIIFNMTDLIAYLFALKDLEEKLSK